MDVSVHGDAAVVECHGRIVGGETADRFGSCVAGLVATHDVVVLDLAGVTYCDARGLGTLAGLLEQAGGYDGRLVVASSSERLSRLLCLTQLFTHMRVAYGAASRHSPVDGHAVRRVS